MTIKGKKTSFGRLDSEWGQADLRFRVEGAPSQCMAYCGGGETGSKCRWRSSIDPHASSEPRRNDGVSQERCPPVMRSRAMPWICCISKVTDNLGNVMLRARNMDHTEMRKWGPKS